MVVPALTTVTLVPLIVATAVLLLVKLIGKEEELLATRSNGTDPTLLTAKALKVMV